MAKLNYPDVIAKDKVFTALANTSLQLARIDLMPLMHQFIELVPEAYLYLLAEKWSVTGWDGWHLAKTPRQQRDLIKSAYKLHALKGTPFAIREVFRVLGLGEVDLIEGLSGQKHDGTIKRRDGTFSRGSRDKWAHYVVQLKRPVTNDQAQQIKQMLKQFAPTRCVLAALDYRAVAFLHNGEIKQRNGQYNRGAA